MLGMLEPHYTAPELAKLWKLSPGVVRSMFENEPDVLTIKRPETRYKRGYTTYKIPESVVRRVYARHLQRTSPAAR